MSLTECCGAKVLAAPGDGGALETWCYDCHEQVCSECAPVFSREDGYGTAGDGIRTFALCDDCFANREFRREMRAWRRDSGV